MTARGYDQPPCERPGCGDLAVLVPVLELRSRLGPTFESVLNLPLCAAHAAELQLDHVLSDEGFDRMTYTLVAAGRPAPERALTTLRLLSLDEPQVVLLRAHSRAHRQ